MNSKRNFSLLVIGGSAGALLTVLDIVSMLEKNMAFSVVVVLHRKQTEVDTLIDLISSRSDFMVKEVEDKDELKEGWIYVAPPDYHVLLEKNAVFSLDASEKVNYSRPSIDVTFESAADVIGDGLMCVLLSGANADGVAGLVFAKSQGAFIVVQDPAVCEFPFMPQHAIDEVAVDMLLNKDNMPLMIALLAGT